MHRNTIPGSRSRITAFNRLKIGISLSRSLPVKVFLIFCIWKRQSAKKEDRKEKETEKTKEFFAHNQRNANEIGKPEMFYVDRTRETFIPREFYIDDYENSHRLSLRFFVLG